MQDKRPIHKTKTFYGAVAFAALIILSAFNVPLPYEALLGLNTVWTGYAVADRFKK